MPETLIDAVRRGVAVEVIVSGAHLESTLVRGPSRHRWGALLENGVRIYEHLPTMFHRKVMIIDDLWVSVGSANFDNRSFRLNDEANLNVFDSEFALEERKVFARDKLLAREVTWDQWKQRPLRQKGQRCRLRAATVTAVVVLIRNLDYEAAHAGSAGGLDPMATISGAT